MYFEILHIYGRSALPKISLWVGLAISLIPGYYLGFLSIHNDILLDAVDLATSFIPGYYVGFSSIYDDIFSAAVDY